MVKIKHRVASVLLTLCMVVALFAGLGLALPAAAYALETDPATAITIGGAAAQVDTPVSGSNGGTYTFDGAGTLTLDGYNDPANPIDWSDGFLNIVVKGGCYVQGIKGRGTSGLLTVSGDGTLTLNASGSAIILVNALTVDRASVTATNTDTGSDFPAVTPGGDVRVTNKGKLIASTAGTDNSDGIHILSGNLHVDNGGEVRGESAERYGVNLTTGNMVVESGGSVTGLTSGTNYGLALTGNATVDGGSLTGSGAGGISVTNGDLTLTSGTVAGTSSGSFPGITVSRSATVGGKITVLDGTLTGTNSFATSTQLAAGIQTKHGMEIKGGTVVGETANPGAAAVWVQGEILDMSGGELEATNTSTTGTAAYGLLAEAGITMTRNSKITGTSKSGEIGGTGVLSWDEITLMGSDAGRPSMTGTGACGIAAHNLSANNYRNIVVRQATVHGIGSLGAGIQCMSMEVANSVVNAESKETTAIICDDRMDLSGENTLEATGAGAGIYASNTFKAQGTQYVHAAATGNVKGADVVDPFGLGIVMGGGNNFDVDLTKGYIQATGVAGKIQPVGYNAPLTYGGGIAFINNNANVTLGANTKAEGGQVLVQGDPANDYFTYAYGKDGVVATETVIYADVEYSISVMISGNGTSTPGSIKLRALENQEFKFEPAPGYKLNSLTVDGVAQTVLDSYTVVRIVRDHEIKVEFVSDGTIQPPSTDHTATQTPGTLGPGTDAVFVFNGEYVHFSGATVIHQDGTTYSLKLGADSGGTRDLSFDNTSAGKAESSSVKITLYAAWLDTLPAGTYTLKVDFDDGTVQSSGSADFVLTRAADTTPATATASPQTGDNTNIPLWALCGGLAALGLVLLLHRRVKQ